MTNKKIWAMHTSHENGETSITLHKTKRECLEEIGSVYGLPIVGMTTDRISQAVDKLGVWVTVQEVEAPE